MTIKDFFLTFPEPYKTQAIENSLHINLYTKVNNVSEAIGFGFSFSSSKEGKNYWRSFQIALNEGEIELQNQK